MKTVFRISALAFFALTCVVFFAINASLAQNREQHFISARAGGVNFVAGDVSYRHGSETNWHRLSTRHNLISGDVIKTGAASQVETLLNPGSYVRMGESSEFEMTDASLDSLRLKLLSGSVIIEATGYEQSVVEITVETPQTHAKIIRSGIYRFNVLPTKVTEVAVRKGRALVGEENLLVKGDHVARVSESVSVVKLEKTKDALDLWSKARASQLAEANRELARRNNDIQGLNSALSNMSFDNSSYSQGTGIWVFSLRSNCYTFLPFYYGWNSPYGNGYGSSLGFYPSCGACPNPRPIVNNGGYPGGGVGGTVGVNPGGNPPGGGGGNSGGNAPAPQMQREQPPMMPSRPDTGEREGRTPTTHEALPPFE